MGSKKRITALPESGKFALVIDEDEHRAKEFSSRLMGRMLRLMGHSGVRIPSTFRYTREVHMGVPFSKLFTEDVTNWPPGYRGVVVLNTLDPVLVKLGMKHAGVVYRFAGESKRRKFNYTIEKDCGGVYL